VFMARGCRGHGGSGEAERADGHGGHDRACPAPGVQDDRTMMGMAPDPGMESPLSHSGWVPFLTEYHATRAWGGGEQGNRQPGHDAAESNVAP
jgi:hypothetical protein